MLWAVHPGNAALLLRGDQQLLPASNASILYHFPVHISQVRLHVSNLKHPMISGLCIPMQPFYFAGTNNYNLIDASAYTKSSVYNSLVQHWNMGTKVG